MNRRIPHRAPRPASLRTSSLAARPGRLAATALAVTTVTAALLLLWAAAAQASVWVIPAMSRRPRPRWSTGRAPCGARPVGTVRS